MVRPAARYMLAAAEHMTPRRQGELDCLCGLYSILNALRLAAYPRRISADVQAELFAAGVTYLNRHDLLNTVLVGGICYDNLRNMARFIVRKAERRHRIKVTLQEHPKKLPAADRDEWMIQQLWAGAPIVCEYMVQAHVAVCIGWTPRRWIIFDTDGRRHVRRGPDGRCFAVVTQT